MEKILKLYTYVDGVNDIAFPSESEHVIIPSFTYNAKRMGDAPTISFSFMHIQCLDDLWNDMVYAEFNGERYYIKQTPSSSFDNTDSRYKHSVEMVSERAVLSDIFLFDVVTKNQGEDKPASNNSNVVFFGDIHEFASRINLSLSYSGVEYRVNVPSNITSEAKLMSLNKQYISQALAEIYKTYGLFYQFDGKVIRVSRSENEIQDVFEYGSDKALISTSKNNANKRIITRCTGIGSSDNIPYYYPNPTPYGELNILYNGAITNNVAIFDWGRFAKCGITNTLKYSQVSVSGGDDKIYPLSKFEQYDVIDLTPITGESSYGWVGYCKFEINESYHDVVLEIKNDFGSRYANLEIKNNDGTPVWWGNEMPENGIRLSYGNYTAYVTFDVGSDDYEAETTARQYGKITLTLKRTPLTKEGWVLNGVIVDLNNFGIRCAGTAELGDEISFHQVAKSRIPASPYLMPYIYRDTKGEEVFYHAQNDTYRDDKGVYYVFDNIYVEGRPKEDIIELEDIKPTIEGVINNGNRIDTFVDFECDDDDSDEVDNNGNYVHPYFFAKLNRLDFNLFAHSIEGKPMTIAMTSGSCGACQWTIGVDDNTQANLVQVDENGDLLRDDNGNVRCGRAGTQREIAQSGQNDTINNEVWIALKKEYNTFGIIMPNKANNYKPGIGDTFVILNINLPHSYIVKAEQRLTEAIIKHMYDNNAEKFNFGIKFSRIYLQEHEDVLKNLNENSAINIKYNGRQFTLHASSYTYKITDNEALPEISLELSDEISISNGTILKAISKVETDVEKVGKKTLAEVQNISTKKANKSTTLEGYGITDAYTRAEAVKEFIPTRTDAEVSGIKDFTDGFKVGGILIKYDALKDALIFPSNVIVNKGVAWNSRLEDFSDEEIFTITGAVQVDWKTIGKNENGELYVIGGTSGGGGGVVGGVTIDEVKNYLTAEKYTTEMWVSSQNYATQSWVADKGYITGITRSMVTSALGYTPFNSANFTKAKIKSTLDISDWALASAKPSYKFSEISNKPTTLSGYGITDAYTKNEVSEAITEAFNDFASKVSNDGVVNTYKELIDYAASHGADFTTLVGVVNGKADKATTLAGYGIVDAYTKAQVDTTFAKQSDITEEFKKYVTLSTAQTITGIKNFSNGFKVGNVLVSYNASKNAFIFPANAIFEGGIAWNSKLDGFSVPTIMDAIQVDGETISKDKGYLEFVGKTGGGGGTADSVAWENVTGRPTKLSQFTNDSGFITSASLPTKLSQFTDDVISGNYLPIKGIAEGARTLKGFATSSSWLVAAGNGFNVHNNSSTKRCWFGFSLPEGSPYATTKWVFGASDSSYNAAGEIYAKHISLGYGDSTTTGGYALRANGNAKIDGSLTLNGKIISYNASNNAFILPANVIIEGGVAWNSKLDGFDIPTIMDAVIVDGDTIVKENGVLKVNGDVSGGIDETQLGNYLTRNNYAKKSDIPSLSGYATEAFVTSRGYITSSAIPTKVSAFTNDASYATESFVTSRGYITSAAISKANIKSILGISDWALAATSPLVNHGKITSATDLTALTTGLGYTQGYTPVDGTYNYGQLINFATYRGITQIYISDDVSNGGTIHFRTDWEKTKLPNRVWHEILSSKTYTKYAMSLTTDQDVTGVKNYLNGFKVGSNLITYDANLKAFVLNGNLIVKGGIAWEKQNS